jgi:hypothetical protein
MQTLKFSQALDQIANLNIAKTSTVTILSMQVFIANVEFK